MKPDCGHCLSPRAGTIEHLARLLCDIDRGRWYATGRERTPATRRIAATQLESQVAQVPPDHCPSCGCPQHGRRPSPPPLMGNGR